MTQNVGNSASNSNNTFAQLLLTSCSCSALTLGVWRCRTDADVSPLWQRHQLKGSSPQKYTWLPLKDPQNYTQLRIPGVY